MTSRIFHRITVALSALQLLVIRSKLHVARFRAVKFNDARSLPPRLFQCQFWKLNFQKKTALIANGFNVVDYLLNDRDSRLNDRHVRNIKISKMCSPNFALSKDKLDEGSKSNIMKKNSANDENNSANVEHYYYVIRAYVLSYDIVKRAHNREAIYHLYFIVFCN